jgi:hypothetical protein
MKKNELATAYAKQKANSVITEAIEQAFTAGYDAGYLEGYGQGKANTPVEQLDTEFVDLGLTSGTLWAKDFVRDKEGEILFLPHDEALRFNLPTKVQWEELKNECVLKFEREDKYWDRDRFYFLGANGNEIMLKSQGYYLGSSLERVKNLFFWVNEQNSLRYEFAASMYIVNNKNLNGESTQKVFKGFRLPILLVKNK